MRKVLCSVLAFVICSFSITTYVKAENETSEADLQTQREELKTQIDETSKQLENVQSELSQNLQQVDKLDETIRNSKTELEELNLKIVKLQNEMDEVETKLQIAEENYDKQKEILDKNLLVMYETSETHYLDVLLNSRSISEFLSNYFLISEIASYETQLLEDMKEKKDNISISKKRLEKNQNTLADIKASQLKTEKILENTRLVRENFIAKLSDEEKQLQAEIDEYNARFEEINREILQEALQGIDSTYIGGELAWPVPGYTRVTSPYGMRYHPIQHYTKLHSGVDIAAPMGVNFVAANDGIVTKATYNVAYGNMVMIDHGGGISTLYAHGSEILVQVGQTVTRGETVLKIGSTGYSTGPHAHFEVRINGVTTDPMPYITNGLIPGVQENEEQ